MTSVWFDSLANVTVEHFPTRAEALAAEQQAILTERPLFNRANLPVWSGERRNGHSELIRAGQARARAEGRIGGRPLLYSDEAIGDAIRRHDAGETWAAVAARLGISEPQLYARINKLRRECADAKAT